MLELRLLPQAIIDLEAIYEFTLLTWGFNQAEKYQDDLYDSMITITKNSNIGSVYYFKKGNYRKLHANRHLIFYRLTKKEVIVIRILHEKMNLKIHL